VIAIRMVVGVAAVMVLAAAYLGTGLLKGPDRDAMAPMEATAVQGSVENDPLLASTDPATILLTGPARLLALNDPALAPHSLWDQ
jgi:hypothetical protein